MKQVIFVILLFSFSQVNCDMHKYPEFEFNEHHVKERKKYYDFLLNHHLLDGIDFDYSYESLEKIQDSLSIPFLEGEFDPHEEVTPYFEFALIVYIGEIYMIRHKECKWISSHRERLIPHAIRNSDKEYTYMIKFMHKTIHEYPYGPNYGYGNREALFNFTVIYKAIEYELS